MENEPKLGATGRYPHGKTRPDDEGELRAMMSTKDGNIFIDFGKPLSWLSMPPEQALQFAKLLEMRATAILSQRAQKT